MTGGSFAISDSASEHGRFAGIARIRGPSWIHLPVLSICMLGVQIFWSVELSYASPYLLSLGLSKSSMAVVFVAGPLSGLLVQPLVGVMADNSTSRWGRRRPYMLFGTLLCVLAMLLLGWTKIVSGWFLTNSSTLTISLAVLSIYLMDFSINAVQAVDRALLVDTLPPSLQPSGNAWAAKMLAVGSVAGFFLGGLELPKIVPFFGNTELKVLSIIGSLILLATQMTTMIMVDERILLESSQTRAGGPFRHFIQEVKAIWANILTLPRVIRQICIIQFFAWLGWFPVLFYTSVYIGDLHKRAFYATVTIMASPVPSATSIELTPETLTLLEADATRLGSRALLFSGLVTLSMNFLLPLFITEASANSRRRKQRRHQQTVANGFGSSHDLNAQRGYTSAPATEGMYGRGGRIVNWISNCAVPERLQFHLSTLWAASHAVFAICMLGTFFTSTVAGATTLITVTGFSWAVTSWAPFALLGEAILTEPSPANGRESIQLTDTRRSGSITLTRASSESRRELALRQGDPVRDESSTFAIDDDDESASGSDNEDDEEQRRKDKQKRQLLLRNSAAVVSQADIRDEEERYLDDDEDEGEDAVLVGHRRSDVEGQIQEQSDPASGGGLSAKAGIILGIHNIFIVIPQFLVTGISSVIFAIFDPAKSVLHGKHPGNILNGNRTMEVATAVSMFSLRQDGGEMDVPSVLEQLEDIESAASSNSLVYIFRLGGVAALAAFVLCWRLSRELRHR